MKVVTIVIISVLTGIIAYNLVSIMNQDKDPYPLQIPKPRMPSGQPGQFPLMYDPAYTPINDINPDWKR